MQDGEYEAREAYLERLAADVEPPEPDWLKDMVAEIQTWWIDEPKLQKLEN